MTGYILDMNQFLNMDDVPDGVVVCDREGRIQAASVAFLELFGYADGELIGKPIEVLIPARYPGHARQRERYQEKASKRPMGAVQKIFGLRKDGTEIPLDISLQPDSSGERVICFARDASEHVRLTEGMHRTARLDPVTNTWNRRAFGEDLKQAVSERAAFSKGICISLFDIDRFKDVNDTLGHSAGDQLLAAFCDRLREVMRPTMQLYRIGGDEFALIMQCCAERERGLAFVEAAMAHLQRPLTVHGHSIPIGCSAGVVQAPTDGETAEELISNADLALYKAKTVRGSSAAYTPELRDSVEQRFTLLSELRDALREEQFVLHFQPKVNLRSGVVVGAEALLRWSHPARGVMQPAQFIDIAADSELALPIGRWVIAEACRRAAEWNEAAGRPVSVAVNVFPNQAKRSHTLREDVENALSQAGLEPALLEIEITENTVLDSSQEFREVLAHFRSSGISIALDDFGTGYASLNSLTDFPIDTIKIDRRFIRGVSQREGNDAVLKAMATLGRELGLKSVAEGVESVEEALLVRHYGCDLGQGYYWGKPAPHADFMRMLEQPMKKSLAGQGVNLTQMQMDYLEKILKHRFPKSA